MDPVSSSPTLGVEFGLLPRTPASNRSKNGRAPNGKENSQSGGSLHRRLFDAFRSRSRSRSLTRASEDGSPSTKPVKRRKSIVDLLYLSSREPHHENDANVQEHLTKTEANMDKENYASKIDRLSHAAKIDMLQNYSRICQRDGGVLGTFSIQQTSLEQSRTECHKSHRQFFESLQSSMAGRRLNLQISRSTPSPSLVVTSRPTMPITPPTKTRTKLVRHMLNWQRAV